jgi:hypothetical protein
VYVSLNPCNGCAAMMIVSNEGLSCRCANSVAASRPGCDDIGTHNPLEPLQEVLAEQHLCADLLSAVTRVGDFYSDWFTL